MSIELSNEYRYTSVQRIIDLLSIEGIIDLEGKVSGRYQEEIRLELLKKLKRNYDRYNELDKTKEDSLKEFYVALKDREYILKDIDSKREEKLYNDYYELDSVFFSTFDTTEIYSHLFPMNLLKFIIKKDFTKIKLRHLEYEEVGLKSYLTDVTIRDKYLPYESKIKIPNGKLLFINFLDDNNYENKWAKSYGHYDGCYGLNELTIDYAKENIFYAQTGNLTMKIYHSETEKRFIMTSRNLFELLAYVTLTDIEKDELKKQDTYLTNNNYKYIGEVSNDMWRVIVCHQDELLKNELEETYPDRLFYDMNIEQPIELSMTNYFRTKAECKPEHSFINKKFLFYADELIIIDYI